MVGNAEDMAGRTSLAGAREEDKAGESEQPFLTLNYAMEVVQVTVLQCCQLVPQIVVTVLR